jgi:hypothetical protein
MNSPAKGTKPKIYFLDLQQIKEETAVDDARKIMHKKLNL